MRCAISAIVFWKIGRQRSGPWSSRLSVMKVYEAGADVERAQGRDSEMTNDYTH